MPTIDDGDNPWLHNMGWILLGYDHPMIISHKGNTLTYPYILFGIVWIPDDATKCVLSGDIVCLVTAGIVQYSSAE